MEAISIMSMALGAASAVAQGNAESKASSQKAQDSLYAQQSAEINASATDAYYRNDLRTTLSNITAIRAASGMSDSPTSQAVADYNTDQSDIQRTAKVTSYLSQAKQSGQASQYYQQAASDYQSIGYLNAGAGFLKGFSSSPSFKSWIGG